MNQEQQQEKNRTEFLRVVRPKNKNCSKTALFQNRELNLLNPREFFSGTSVTCVHKSKLVNSMLDSEKKAEF